MNLDNLKKYNTNIPSNIKKVYLLKLFDNLNSYFNGSRKLICLKYNNNLIISDDMIHLSISDILEKLSNIGKIICNKPINVLEISYAMDVNIYYYLNYLQPEDIIDIYSSFYYEYFDFRKENLCQYLHVINYYIINEEVMPPKMFNFFNTLISEDDRINDIIDIPNIIKYLTKMCIYTPSQILNKDVIKKISKLLDEKT